MTENFSQTADSSSLSEPKSGLNLLDLPEEVLLHILSFMSYHNVSEIRRICQAFNRLCQQALTQGFLRVDKFHSAIQRRVKSQLPRRESERRNHSLARHVDILSAIETRLSLLNMTYMKYIDVGLCAFIPGKVLDELFRILRVLQESAEPPRAHEFLQELRDISSMAMEHFEEKIVPLVKQKIPPLSMPVPFGEPGDSQSVSRSYSDFLTVPTSPRQDMVRLQHQVRSQGLSLQNFRKEMIDMRIKMAEHKKRLMEQDKKNIEQCRIITEQNSTLLEQDRKLSDLSRKILEYDQKFSDIFAELSKAGCSSVGYKSSSASSTDASETDKQASQKHPQGINKSTVNRKRQSSHPVSTTTERKQSSGKRRKT
ncbi:F-box only protein 28-like [Liolophura sinensis]|uniref:F-box only protein 28-like n=1 Tax=Liolophura sinensis TaxID=3198878 RepID=UPI003158829B